MLRISRFIGCLIGLALFFSLPSFAQDLKSAIRLTESEQFDAAQKAFDAVLAKEPNNGDVYYYYGELWLKKYFVDSTSVSLKEVTDPALAKFKAGIEKDSLDPLNYVGAGRVDILLGKYTDANTLFTKAIGKLPWKNFSKAAIPVTKQALTFARIAEAKLKLPGKTQAELLEIIDKAVERSPNVPEVYLIKGDIYLEYNDGSNAIVAYNKANDLDPQSCKAMVKIGQLWVRGKSYNDALGYYKDAIKIDSTFAPAYRERAELYGLAGQWENGLKDYKKFLDLSGNNTYAKVRYASFLFMAKKYDEAINLIMEIQTSDPSSVKEYNVLNRLAAYSYYETAKYADGLKAIDTFFKNTKQILASDYIYNGDILTKLNNDSVAIGKYLLAFNMDSANCDLITKMAKSYSKLKAYEKAVKMYQKKMNNNCITLIDYYEMGKSYYNAQQWGKADTAFGVVLDKKPDMINALLYKARSNANMDTTSVLGKAKPYYEQLFALCLKTDSVKYLSNITEAYGYLMYYHFKQYNLNKKCEDAKSGIMYCEKMLAISPKDEKSTTIKKNLVGKCPN